MVCIQQPWVMPMAVVHLARHGLLRQYQYFQIHPVTRRGGEADKPPVKGFAICKMLARSASSAKLGTSEYVCLAQTRPIPFGWILFAGSDDDTFVGRFIRYSKFVLYEPGTAGG